MSKVIDRLEALQFFRKSISEGRPLRFEDSEETGNKYTVCSWGFCSDNLDDWGDLISDKEVTITTCRYGEVTKALLRRVPVSKCPMDKRDGIHLYGCFYHCRVFKSNGNVSREQALELFDKAIEDEQG